MGALLDDRDRFAIRRNNQKAFGRYMRQRCYMIRAWDCHAKGDLAGFAHWKAEAFAPDPPPAPPIAMAERRPAPAAE
jgi:hypothetical protein